MFAVVDLRLPWHQGGPFAVETRSGTSAPAAYVAGILATFVSWEKLTDARDTARLRLLLNTIRGELDDSIGNSANFLANNGIDLNTDPTIPYRGGPAEEEPAKRKRDDSQIQRRQDAAAARTFTTSKFTPDTCTYCD